MKDAATQTEEVHSDAVSFPSDFKAYFSRASDEVQNKEDTVLASSLNPFAPEYELQEECPVFGYSLNPYGSEYELQENPFPIGYLFPPPLCGEPGPLHVQSIHEDFFPPPACGARCEQLLEQVLTLDAAVGALQDQARVLQAQARAQACAYEALAKEVDACWPRVQASLSELLVENFLPALKKELSVQAHDAATGAVQDLEPRIPSALPPERGSRGEE